MTGSHGVASGTMILTVWVHTIYVYGQTGRRGFHDTNMLGHTARDWVVFVMVLERSRFTFDHAWSHCDVGDKQFLWM